MKQYIAPKLVEYGAIASITGVSGTNGESDVFTTVNGKNEDLGRTGSIDGCARTQPGGKCCSSDPGVC